MTEYLRPTSAECAHIRAAAKRESTAAGRTTNIGLQPGRRFNVTSLQESFNCLVVSDDVDHGDSDMADRGTWLGFRRKSKEPGAVELDFNGRAVVDFYIHDHDGLVSNVIAYFDVDGLVFVEGVAIHRLYVRPGFDTATLGTWYGGAGL